MPDAAADCSVLIYMSINGIDVYVCSANIGRPTDFNIFNFYFLLFSGFSSCDAFCYISSFFNNCYVYVLSMPFSLIVLP